MAQQLLNNRLLSFIAGVDLSGKIYHLVKLQADGEIELATENSVVIGVLQDKPKLKEAGLVAVGETSKVILGDSVAIGDELISNATGKAIKRPTPGVGITVDYNIVGYALESGVADSVIEFLVRPLIRRVTG